MGINNLWGALKEFTGRAHLYHFEGKRVAVDTYVWLHCAAVAMGGVTLHVREFLRYCDVKEEEKVEEEKNKNRKNRSGAGGGLHLQKKEKEEEKYGLKEKEVADSLTEDVEFEREGEEEKEEGFPHCTTNKPSRSSQPSSPSTPPPPPLHKDNDNNNDNNGEKKEKKGEEEDELTRWRRNMIRFNISFLDHVVKQVRRLQSFGIIPVCVFDGRALPLKRDTNARRRVQREEHFLKAMNLLLPFKSYIAAAFAEAQKSRKEERASSSSSRKPPAPSPQHPQPENEANPPQEYDEEDLELDASLWDLFYYLPSEELRRLVFEEISKAFDITTEVAEAVMTVLKEDCHVECIVAPYEADSQLSYLCKSGYVTACLSEDSDLIAYFCPQIIAKTRGGGAGGDGGGGCDVIRPPVACPSFFEHYVQKKLVKKKRGSTTSSPSIRNPSPYDDDRRGNGCRHGGGDGHGGTTTISSPLIGCSSVSSPLPSPSFPSLPWPSHPLSPTNLSPSHNRSIHNNNRNNMRNAGASGMAVNMRDEFSYDHFLLACIMAGCDYVPNLNRIGFKTAYCILSRCQSMKELAQVLMEEYRFPSDEIRRYLHQLYRAYYAFTYAIVYCPIQKSLVHFNPLPRAMEGSAMTTTTGVLGVDTKDHGGKNSDEEGAVEVVTSNNRKEEENERKGTSGVKRMREEEEEEEEEARGRAMQPPYLEKGEETGEGTTTTAARPPGTTTVPNSPSSASSGPSSLLFSSTSLPSPALCRLPSSHDPRQRGGGGGSAGGSKASSESLEQGRSLTTQHSSSCTPTTTSSSSSPSSSSFLRALEEIVGEVWGNELAQATCELGKRDPTTLLPYRRLYYRTLVLPYWRRTRQGQHQLTEFNGFAAHTHGSVVYRSPCSSTPALVPPSLHNHPNGGVGVGGGGISRVSFPISSASPAFSSYITTCPTTPTASRSFSGTSVGLNTLVGEEKTAPLHANSPPPPPPQQKYCHHHNNNNNNNNQIMQSGGGGYCGHHPLSNPKRERPMMVLVRSCFFGNRRKHGPGGWSAMAGRIFSEGDGDEDEDEDEEDEEKLRGASGVREKGIEAKGMNPNELLSFPPSSFSSSSSSSLSSSKQGRRGDEEEREEGEGEQEAKGRSRESQHQSPHQQHEPRSQDSAVRSTLTDEEDESATQDSSIYDYPDEDNNHNDQNKNNRIANHEHKEEGGDQQKSALTTTTTTATFSPLLGHAHEEEEEERKNRNEIQKKQKKPDEEEEEAIIYTVDCTEGPTLPPASSSSTTASSSIFFMKRGGGEGTGTTREMNGRRGVPLPLFSEEGRRKRLGMHNPLPLENVTSPPPPPPSSLSTSLLMEEDTTEEKMALTASTAATANYTSSKSPAITTDVFEKFSFSGMPSRLGRRAGTRR